MCAEVCCIILGLLLIIVLINKRDYFTVRKRVCNSDDNRCYKVVSKFHKNTQKDASKLLAYLNKYAVSLLKHLRRKYLWERKGTHYQQQLVEYLLENYNPDSIIENNPINNVNTSYVEDKGKIFAICLREKTSKKDMFHDNNILEFVVMHEMSHMSTPKIGHDNLDFWVNFKFLITEATELLMHNPINYKKNPINYCHLDVDYNPYYDKTLPITL